MPDRKCGTCRHFQPAPMWRKGWCRNPLLYQAHQSHLVAEDDLDCNRGMGSFWEAIDEDAPADETIVRFAPPPQRTIAPAGSNPRQERRVTRAVEPIEVRRAGEQSVAHSRTRPARPDPDREAITEGYEVAQEHYSPADFLRRSYPVIGIILLLGAFWVGTTRLLATDRSATPTAPVGAAAIAASPAAAVVITPTAVAPPGPTPTPTLPVAPPGVVAPGARVVVATEGAGANIREQPTTSAAVIIALDDGTPLTITGPSKEADGYVWWPVRGEGFQGWVVSSLFVLAP